ncbi:unnamed protein product [Effrenium voratum]|nr:unnamed protein product [Effrenium voratum]
MVLDAVRCSLSGLSASLPLAERLRLRLGVLSTEERLRQAEAKLLQNVSKVHISEVPVGQGETIHTLSLAKSGAAGLAPVLLIHGYFMGSASWAQSMEPLTTSGRSVHAIDWPGWGLSTRNNFSETQGAEACEDFFVEGIEHWRRAMGLERVVLLGHSFGGYFAACYAMKYPQRVESLILASPVGMLPKSPDAGFTEERLQSMAWWQRILLLRVQKMWEAGWTPMDFVRALGPLGAWLTSWYMDRRFSRPRALGLLGQLDAEASAEYLHRLAQRRGSEQCLGQLLDFGAWPKLPLAPRLARRLAEAESAVPVTLLYGQQDWMDVNGGAWLARQLRDETQIIVVENAGHQLFLDNPQAFNAAALRSLGHGPANAADLYRQL